MTKQLLSIESGSFNHITEIKFRSFDYDQVSGKWEQTGVGPDSRDMIFSDIAFYSSTDTKHDTTQISIRYYEGNEYCPPQFTMDMRESNEILGKNDIDMIFAVFLEISELDHYMNSDKLKINKEKK